MKVGIKRLGKIILQWMFAFVFLCLGWKATVSADPTGPISKVDAWNEAKARWKQIEPGLFTEDGSKKYVGQEVVFTATPVSLGDPLVLKLDSGAICYVTHVNRANRAELTTFHRPPSKVSIFGVLTKIDPKQHCFTVPAGDTYWEQ